MRTLIVLLALLSAACGPLPTLPNPTSRAEACARIDGMNRLGGNAFCRVGGAPCDPLRGDVTCLTINPGEQSVCIQNAPAFQTPSARAAYQCGPNNTPCLPWWECREFTIPGTTRTEFGCFPGPPCDSSSDAGTDQ